MKVNRVDYDYSLGEHKILVNGYETLVGKYKTKERALEVLNNIQHWLIQVNDNKQQVIVYEMPKE